MRKKASLQSDEEFVTKMMGELRTIRAANGKAVQYTQGQHDLITTGFMMAFGGLSTLREIIRGVEQKLEQQGPAYKGVWQPGRTYASGSFVTHGGSMFHADKETSFKPGEGGGWTLAVKAGRDGKAANQ
jgi:hypothetical protein